ncbi:uncharacterized protein HMPREF1541_04268 [Cyphellophora europaea CBS 101466]|uniref:Major facilitator superfamily (MFS) profile domain-containing protein n=1 Tax=Cyphellophora europaea (strain CBS 101466) TaxID=1220924 RepID=W2RW60_CYPE1|nr:uncharacterized protein HMPREF1541_04268 [Cyphellophora europaea CBS 101466]ETN39993.1 hypothetical protein HMPREF1541_04268 [Cyphellophora europaea CBS 101466]
MKTGDRTTVTNPANEATPLLPRAEDLPPPASEKAQSWLKPKPIHLVLLCGFFASLSFGVTQVPIVYVFRLMTCEAYYAHHPTQVPHDGRDRCSLPTIEAGTARAVSLLGITTTFFGVINLFITGWTIKRLGVKAALALQVLTPASRLLVQNVGVLLGGSTGIIVVQASQVVTVMGGPNGYMLALNTYVTELTGHEGRTGTLGRLQGCMMFGSAIGFLIGGVLAEAFHIETPFQFALVLFLASTGYVLLCLPWIPGRKEEQAQSSSGVRRMLGPLKTILPSRWMQQDGHIRTEHGAIFLAAGAFCGVLATGYIPTLLQMYATDIFDFGTRRNSYLVSTHSFLRGLYLTVVFPRIIKLGRHLFDKHHDISAASSSPTSGTATPSERTQLANAMQDEEQEDVSPPKPRSPATADADAEPRPFTFDLTYTRASILIDGILTAGAAFVSQGWQMYLIAALLPFGAGTASAAKGVILQMCAPSERTDALSAIALVEMMARLSTTFVFGLVFAAFAAMEKTYFVFVCNAAVALAGFAVLLLSRFPVEGSRRLQRTETEADREEVAARNEV